MIRKTSRNIEFITKLGKDRVGVDNNSTVECNSKCELDSGKLNSSEIDGMEVENDKIAKEKNLQKHLSLKR